MDEQPAVFLQRQPCENCDIVVVLAFDTQCHFGIKPHEHFTWGCDGMIQFSLSYKQDSV